MAHQQFENDVVDVVQLVERQIVILVVEGSNPFIHPTNIIWFTSSVGRAHDF